MEPRSVNRMIDAGMLRASRDEALTDALTGLGNRRALTRALSESLPEGTHVLALFDLDGFKQYNDTFGHPAGDVLLGAPGRASRDGVVDGTRQSPTGWAATSSACSDVPATTGERERCRLQRPRLQQSAMHSRSAARTASPALPAEAAGSEALRLADQRMYASKNAGRMSAARQAHDVRQKSGSNRHYRGSKVVTGKVGTNRGGLGFDVPGPLGPVTR